MPDLTIDDMQLAVVKDSLAHLLLLINYGLDKPTFLAQHWTELQDQIYESIHCLETLCPRLDACDPSWD